MNLLNIQFDVNDSTSSAVQSQNKLPDVDNPGPIAFKMGIIIICIKEGLYSIYIHNYCIIALIIMIILIIILVFMKCVLLPSYGLQY